MITCAPATVSNNLFSAPSPCVFTRDALAGLGVHRPWAAPAHRHQTVASRRRSTVHPVSLHCAVVAERLGLYVKGWTRWLVANPAGVPCNAGALHLNAPSPCSRRRTGQGSRVRRFRTVMSPHGKNRVRLDPPSYSPGRPAGISDVRLTSPFTNERAPPFESFMESRPGLASASFPMCPSSDPRAYA